MGLPLGASLCFFCFQAELAAQLLEEEWPDEDEVRAARMAVREEATPVPERAWALRNVASTLALGGPGERARARTLLEKAVTLKEQWLDDMEHPGMNLTMLTLHAYCLCGHRGAMGVGWGWVGVRAGGKGRYWRGGEGGRGGQFVSACLRNVSRQQGLGERGVEGGTQLMGKN